MNLFLHKLSPPDFFSEHIYVSKKRLSSFVCRAYSYVNAFVSKLFFSLNPINSSRRPRNSPIKISSSPTNFSSSPSRISPPCSKIFWSYRRISWSPIEIFWSPINFSLSFLHQSFPLDNFCVP